MFGEHPELDGAVRYDLGCTWYSDNGPFFSDLQAVWFVIGVPCMVATLLALASTCKFACCGTSKNTADSEDDSNQRPAVTAHVAGSLYGPLLDVASVSPVDVHIDMNAEVDGYVHGWVRWGAAAAIVHGLLLASLGLFIALHANNEIKFTFLVDAFVALAMSVSKLMVAFCARAVHRHLSPLAREVAQHWTLVIVFSKALMALCGLVLACVYLALAVGGVDANRGDGTRRILQEGEEAYQNETYYGTTPEEQAQLCAAGYPVVWSFMVSLISQSVAGFALFRIYANAVRVCGDPQVFRRVVDCWWGILVVATCGVGIALWLGSGICVFPALDISPLRMMGIFYFCAAACQILAGVTMFVGDSYIRSYWRNKSVPAREMMDPQHPPAATVVGVSAQ